MNEPQRIADVLTGSTDLCAAAILVALHDDPGVEILPTDARRLDELLDMGCVSGSGITPLGARVAMVLRAYCRVRPYPGARA